jgi:predicted DNA binding CopG/RHH family protein
MANDQFRESARDQTQQTKREVEDGHSEQAAPDGATTRDERIVLRVSKDELRRIKRFYDQENIPMSTGIRSLVLNHIRRAR